MNTVRFQQPKKLSKKEEEVLKVANRYDFQVHNMDLAIINGIRRVILSEVPVLGFMGEGEPSIKIHKNNGPLHNEFMIHRLGMLPLHFTEEETEGFVENEWEFYLDMKNIGTSMMNITTNDMKGKKNNVELSVKELQRIFPLGAVTKRPILITRLRQGEELSFTATVVKDIAKTHAAFSPVSRCNFFYIQDDVKNKDVTDVLQRERNYFKNEYGDPLAYHFSIEPETGLSAKYLVAKALEILQAKSEQIDQALNAETEEKVKFIKSDEVEDTYDLHVFNEDDTYGNLFQSIVFSHFLRNPVKILDNKFTMTYIGYYAPHPLDPKIVIRMTLKNDQEIAGTKEEFAVAYKQCLRLVNQNLKEVYDEWIRFD